MSVTEKPWNALRICTPTPVVPPNVSASAASFHEAANDARAEANRNGVNDGTTIWRSAADVGIP